jgi:sulfoxide reductase heme-binding subunit YedZ
MILAMMVTPLVMLLGASGFTRWLMRQRRYLGVAAFGFAALHTVFYLAAEGTLAKILGEALEPGILTGWLAFLIFVPLAVTSNDASVRALGRWWKPLQRWVYPAAVLTLAHWLLVSHGIGGALVHFAPLAVLEAYRIWRNVSRAGRGRIGAAA